MADKMRWRYGDTNPVVAAVDSATVIEIGDLVYQDTDDVRPADSLSDPVEFAERFLGVAMQWSRYGDTDPIRVATTGVFEFDCPPSTFELGDLVGANEAYSGTELKDQQVAPVSTSTYAVARVAKRVATAATSVLVDIRSSVMTNGIHPR